MDRLDGIAAHLFPLGWESSDFDLVNAGRFGETAEGHDLSSVHLWDQVFKDITAGDYEAAVIGTPCETASKARIGPPGPRPLRSPEHIYGLPRKLLSHKEADQVRLGTFFALQSAKVATLLHERDIPWMIENPSPTGNPVSLFNLPEWQELASLPGVKHVDFDQCHMGAETAKPTRILHFKLDLSSLAGKCAHTPTIHSYTDNHGVARTMLSRHPPLVRRKRKAGSSATTAAAASPGEMNKRIAEAIAQSPTSLDTSWRDPVRFARAWITSP